jgi:hypothetical protein
VAGVSPILTDTSTAPAGNRLESSEEGLPMAVIGGAVVAVVLTIVVGIVIYKKRCAKKDAPVNADAEAGPLHGSLDQAAGSELSAHSLAHQSAVCAFDCQSGMLAAERGTPTDAPVNADAEVGPLHGSLDQTDSRTLSAKPHQSALRAFHRESGMLGAETGVAGGALAGGGALAAATAGLELARVHTPCLRVEAVTGSHGARECACAGLTICWASV